MTVGFRIKADFTRVDAALATRAVAVPAANIGDVVNRMQSMRGGFKAYGGRRALAGPAVTVRARAGDNLMLHEALDLAQPGDVVICDAGGDLGTAIMGDIMARHAAKRGIAAIIVDGAVRDIAGLAELHLGVWARSVTPAGPYKDGPGEIGYPVSCGGLVVMPGDLIAADEDGIVVVPREDAAEVVAAAEAHARKEHETIRGIDEGRADRAWVRKLLTEKGVTRI
ncbi:RraA family protein [Roseomonas frigidaquae]|uniref:Putative 4-hydroxy-4-methyl-2-oxoglutarate aldolase n=1 Tax=Falsiroseomonas frigidaquae TaxID=487318 RepID=A0ABX1EU33_9PROT|nr:RraA family protein [Falsiroseomonas frigidaquae]NKE44087.1 RraA family protein [Falsiroseomonas frigidaquae]